MLIEARESRRCTPAEARRIAQEYFGVDAAAAPLAGEFDDNFHLTTPSGAEYVLKIMRPNCPPEFLDLQCRALDRLAGLPVPRVAHKPVETRDGRLVWLLDWLPGKLLADTLPHAPALLSNLGRLLGHIDAALENFSHPYADRELKWDLMRAAWIRDYLEHVPRRAILEEILGRYEALDFGGFRRSVIHGDANTHNVLAEGDRITGLIDFGDIHHGATVAELAVACAYAALGKPDPISAMAHVARGYQEIYPLTELELDALFTLIVTRLAVSAANSAYLKTLSPLEEQQTWELLENLRQSDYAFARYFFGPRFERPILGGIDLRTDPSIVFDLSVGSALLGADPARLETGPLTGLLFGEMRKAGVKVGIGRYNEARPIYTAPEFACGPRPIDEHRTIHLGLDLFAEPGTPVCAPLAGVVHAVANNAKRLDYGPVVILRHNAGFYTLFGHLNGPKSQIGQSVEAGQLIGSIGAPPENGDWPPHLHFQIIRDLLGLDCDFPGVARASERDTWLRLSPDPNLLIGIPDTRFPPIEPTLALTLEARRRNLGHNLSVSYREPLKLVRGWRQYLYDETGRAYLDVYNNVPLVGHSHPRVVEAVQKQIALLNTNTRYLHDNVTRYAARLIAKMPPALRVCYFLNSASEANELALRLARAHIGRDETIVLEHAYHGHTTTLIDISPYKFDGPGGRGRKPWVHVAPLPDPHRRDDPSAGAEYARGLEKLIDGPMTFIAESLPSVGGQVVFPPRYLAACYAAVRNAGGVCIADEVQVGFGRLGDFFWGFEMQGVVPDIVVLGKPMGNGFPLAGVVTTQEIAASFDNGMEFFSTYGGNPVACAAGLAVLDVLEDERLPENAANVGAYLMDRLRELDVVDVRGRGLFIGVELETGEKAEDVVNALRDRGILAGTDGPKHNVIKIRPPLIFSKEDADLFLERLGAVHERE